MTCKRCDGAERIPRDMSGEFSGEIDCPDCKDTTSDVEGLMEELRVAFSKDVEGLMEELRVAFSKLDSNLKDAIAHEFLYPVCEFLIRAYEKIKAIRNRKDV